MFRHVATINQSSWMNVMLFDRLWEYFYAKTKLPWPNKNRYAKYTIFSLIFRVVCGQCKATITQHCSKYTILYSICWIEFISQSSIGFCFALFFSLSQLILRYETCVYSFRHINYSPFKKLHCHNSFSIRYEC